jgi:hypothetical protein
VKTPRIAALAVLALTALTGCLPLTPAEGIVTPWAAVGVMSFKPRHAIEARATQVNAQVARLLNEREQAQRETMLAAR